MSKFAMSATSGGGEFETPEAGNHPAVLVGLVGLGTHEDEYQGQKKKHTKVFLAWELSEEKQSDGSPFFVGRDYNQSFNEKASLRLLVEKWRGKSFAEGEGFDLSLLIGKPCLISLVHKTSQKGRTYARIDGVGALPKGMKPGKPTVEPVVWGIDDDDSVLDAAEWMPMLYGEALKVVVGRCLERKGDAYEAEVEEAAARF